MRSRGHRIAGALVLGLILGVALALRSYRLNWDQGYLFHPDERQIMFVTSRLAFPWPPDWGLLLSPDSPWNPAFFAYGSLPIYLLRIAASGATLLDASYASPRAFHLIGRSFSVLADLGSVVLVYAIGRALYDDLVGLLGASFVTLTVLHIQHAHFYTVDTLLAFLVLLTLYLAVRVVRQPTTVRCMGLGVVFGAALATKISALPLAVPIAIGWASGLALEMRHGGFGSRRDAAAWFGTHLVRGLILCGWVALFVFVLMQPYAVIDLSRFIQDVVGESLMVRGVLDLPYTRQFIGTTPYIYLLSQTVVWSMGIPLGIAGVAGTVVACWTLIRMARRKQWERAAAGAVILSWGLIYLAIVGSFHAKFLRYMLPLIPLMCLWAAAALCGLVRAKGRVFRYIGLGVTALVLLSTALYAAAYMNVYRSTHPWIQATEWICSTVPQQSQLMIEHWDHPLPMLQGRDELRCAGDYRYVTFAGYAADDGDKLGALVDALLTSDYVVISSNRLYNTIPRLPDRYPLTTRYYELLFAEELGYELIYFAQVYPELGGVRLVHDTFRDPELSMPTLFRSEGRRPRDLIVGRADESYSVYDHPMPLVFRRTEELSGEELLALLSGAPG